MKRSAPVSFPEDMVEWVEMNWGGVNKSCQFLRPTGKGWSCISS
jgi:hypothetical protein